MQDTGTPDGPMAMTIDGAVQETTLSRPTLYRYIASGELRVIKVGRRTLIRRTDLEAFLEGLAGKLAG